MLTSPSFAHTSTASARLGTLLVALATVALSSPQFLNFGRLVPVLLVLLALYFLRPWTVGGATAVRLPLLTCIFIAWCASTTMWSVNGGITLVQTTATVLTALLAARLTQVNVTCVMRGVVLGALAVLVLSALVATVAPQYGLAPAGYQAGALQGPYAHRNVLAEVLALGAVSSYCLSTVNHRQLLLKYGSTVLLAGGVVATRSSTALAATLIGFLVYLAARIYQRTIRPFRSLVLVTLLLVVATAISLVIYNQSAVFTLLGRDDSFTGRTVIWTAVNQLIDRQPVLGYGWGATWGVDSAPQRYVEAVSEFSVPNAHSGYLDLALQLGFPGLIILLAICLVIVLRAALAISHRGADSAGAWALASISALALYNIDEPVFVSTVGLFLVFTLHAALCKPDDVTKLRHSTIKEDFILRPKLT